MPKVSIVITTFNRRASLMRALESALAQDFDDLEVLVIDDGSTDGTEELFLSGADPRLRYIRLPKNEGASAARNRGIKESRGEFVMIWDSDDLLYPKTIGSLFAIFDGHPEYTVVSAPARMMEDGKEKEMGSLPEGEVSLQQVLCKEVGNNEKVRLARRTAYLKAPYAARNIDFIVAARLRAQGEWYHLHEPFGEVVLDNPDSLTRSRKRFDPARSADRAPHLHQYMLDFGAPLKKLCPRRYGEIAYGTAIACACAGKGAEARHYALERWKAAPLSPRSYVALLFSVLLPRRSD